jgi:type IV pilus assembly protein PilQ
MNIIFKRAVMTLVMGLMITIGAQAESVNNFTFKDTDIRVVLQAITQLAKDEGKDINIVPGPAVSGTVTIDLANVNWETALNVILRIYNLDAYRQRNVIMVNPLGPSGSVAKNEVQVRVFNLNYIDANDAEKAILPILSSGGKTAVLETTGQSGWEFGMQDNKKAETTEHKLKRTKVLVVSDSAERLEQISTLIDQLDVMPKQILIKARILEVDYNVVKDLGVQWTTAKSTLEAKYNSQSLSPVPSTFTAGVLTSQLTPLTGGMTFAFQQLTGTQAQVVLNALEENTKTNTLSAPILMTLNNQEATILVGTQYPIIDTTVSTSTNNVVGGSLEEYKDIGIQLNVVPQIWGEKEDLINLIIHPVVSSFTNTVDVTDNGVKLVSYPIIDTREAETQLILPDNGTVMLGGLIKENKTNQVIGIPLLDKLPFIGQLFRTDIKGKTKTELIIFITAHIMKPGEEVSPEIMNTKPIEAKFEDKK